MRKRIVVLEHSYRTNQRLLLSFAEAKGALLAARGPFAAAVIELRDRGAKDALALAREVRAMDPATSVIFTADPARSTPLPAGVAEADVLIKPSAAILSAESVRPFVCSPLILGVPSLISIGAAFRYTLPCHRTLITCRVA